MRIIPNITFNGTCEIALNFYKDCFGGEITYLERYKEAPVKNDPLFGEKILHAKFEFDLNTIYASDTFNNIPVKIGDNHSITVEFSKKEKLAEVYNKISKGAKIKTPLQESFFGISFANLTDRYGVTWNLNFIRPSL